MSRRISRRADKLQSMSAGIALGLATGAMTIDLLGPRWSLPVLMLAALAFALTSHRVRTR